ncbi:Porin D precursor [compost metagenome]
MPLTIELSEDGALRNTGDGDPVHISLHRTKFLQGGRTERRAVVLAIALAVRQVEGDAHSGLRLGFFNLQARQHISAKTAPEPDQHQGHVTPAAQQRGQVLAGCGFGLWGLKLDAGSGRSGTGNLPVGDDGQPDDSYARAGGAVKVRISNTVLKFGQMIPNSPVFAQSTSRLMPQTATGFNLLSTDIRNLSIDAGHFTSSTDQVNTNRDGELWATYAHVTTPTVDYAGGKYKVNDNFAVSLYGSRYEDIWNQYYGNANYVYAINKDQALTLDFNVYRTLESGEAKAGEINNTTFGLSAGYKWSAHTFTLAYQQVRGDQPFDYLGFGDTGRAGGSVFLPNSVQYSDFNGPGEKSWQLRYDLNMASYGVPGLSFMARHLRGFDIDGSHVTSGAYARKYGSDDREFETNLEARYVVQSGPAKNLSVRLRTAWHRGDLSTGGAQDQFRVITEYQINIF